MLYGCDVDNDTLSTVVNNRLYNEQIKKYYYKFSHSPSIYFNQDKLLKKAERLDFCNKIWILDYYKDHNIKDFQKTSLCKDKFCSNCKKVKQASRMAKYIPFLEPHKENLFHLTLTVPNCDSDMLRLTIKNMSSSFSRFIRILKGKDKIDGLDFSYLGFEGAIRSLEVTFKNNSYHPHYHVAFCFSRFDFKDSDRTIINSFSYSYGVLTRLFHSLEIIFQKVWYLLINKETVNLKNINALNLGYSCTMDKFSSNDYAELFKYMTKETDENNNILSYENFISLQFGLFRVKQIQGYGCFWNVTDEGDLDMCDEIYKTFIEELRKKEDPLRIFNTPEDLLKDSNTRLVSRKSYFKYFIQALKDT